MSRPAPGVLGALSQRLLSPGEAPMASAALCIGLVVLTALSACGWNQVRQQRAASQAAQDQRVQAAGAVLCDGLRSMLADGDVSAARRLLIASAGPSRLATCRLTLGPGRILADADPHQINVATLPATWVEAQAGPAGTAGPETGVTTLPVIVPGRGTAFLEVRPMSADLGATLPDALTGIGVVGAGTLVALLAFYRRVGSRSRAIWLVREALGSAARGDRSVERLAVDGSLGAEATAWNNILTEVRQSRMQRAMESDGRTAAPNRRSSGGALEAACDAMVDGLILVDPHGCVKFANGAAGVYFQSPRDAMVGRPVRELITDPGALAAVESTVSGTSSGLLKVEVRQALEAGGKGCGGDGVLRYSVRPVRNGDGAAAMVTIEDITQRRIADEARNSFVSQVAHELRTPLTNIRLHVESAIEAGAADVGLREKCLSVISAESLRLERVVGEMLSVSEIEAGSMRIRRDDVRLDALLEECRSEFQAQAEAKHLSLSFELPPKLPVLQGDRDKIALALHNLVGNAIKYTPEGGRVTVSAEERNGTLTIDVADTGIGISPDDAERIFDRFCRARDPRIAKITGTGLGLTLAREVARLHGGDVTVQSQADKGSTFTLTLPSGADA